MFDANGLVPAIAQDAKSGEVLMMAWMNADSLRLTLQTSEVTYWSRTRKSLWRKGETSGHTQRLAEAMIDCDGDTLLLKVEQRARLPHRCAHLLFSQIAALTAEPRMSADDVAKLFISRRSLVQTAALTAAFSPASRVRAAMNADPMTPIPPPPQVPAKEAIATLPGTRLAYWDTGGAGEAVVLLHPATGSARIWSYQQPVFAKAGYRIIAYSRRGYGGSDPVPKENPGTAAGDLHALMDVLGRKKIPSRWLGRGRRHRGGLRALPSGAAVEPGDRLRGRRRPGQGLRRTHRSDSPQGLRRNAGAVPRAFARLSRRQSRRHAAWAALERAALTGNRLGQKPANAVTWARLATLKVPTLVIGGDADLSVPPPLLRTYAAHIPGAELVIVPEAGHSLYWERPDLFNRALLDFFAKHRA